MQFQHQRMVIGYHGCDREVVKKVLIDGELLNESENSFDWLGRGMYFWEYGPERALEFAEEQCRRGKLETPDVLGAYIHLGHCFDLTDRKATEILASYFPSYRKEFDDAGVPLPKNKRTGKVSQDLLLRYLDSSVMNSLHSSLDKIVGSGVNYHTVRGVFVEGEPVFEGSGINTKTHVQIAVRSQDCVIGYFRPNLRKS